MTLLSRTRSVPYEFGVPLLALLIIAVSYWIDLARLEGVKTRFEREQRQLVQSQSASFADTIVESFEHLVGIGDEALEAAREQRIADLEQILAGGDAD